jgi:hypothetical protein
MSRQKVLPVSFLWEYTPEAKEKTMAPFPRTQIEHLSVSRLVMGTNWWLGFSHTSKAKDAFIQDTMDSRKIADVMEVFLAAGIDTLVGIRPDPTILDAVKMAEDRSGKKIISITTPHLDLKGGPGSDANKQTLDEAAATGASCCWPHQMSTDALMDKRDRCIRDMDGYAAMIRERGMIPGLSTHAPESIVYADETGLDIGGYIQIYNAIGFLMQIEVDWVNRVIWNAKHPVLCIKPLAAGKLLPLPGLAFAWSTIRDRDMVAVGCLTPDEAREVIELSLAVMEHRCPKVVLQETRSKTSVKPSA